AVATLSDGGTPGWPSLWNDPRRMQRITGRTPGPPQRGKISEPDGGSFHLDTAQLGIGRGPTDRVRSVAAGKQRWYGRDRTAEREHRAVKKPGAKAAHGAAAAETSDLTCSGPDEASLSDL